MNRRVLLVRRVFLVRHGRTAWNAEGRFQGQADPPLDDVGIAQAGELAALIAALRPDVLVSSDLRRAMQTAEPIELATGVPVLADARLRERSLGHWEGLTRAEVQQAYPDEYGDWVAGRDVSRRGGESRAQVAARACLVLGALPDVEVAILVTHSATAMALASAALGLSQEVHVLSPLANCHWSELRHEPSERGSTPWRLRAHNVGAPGAVIPFALQADLSDEDSADASA